ncbi:hypothetical protein BH11PLA2_BH11PLA2_27950 [soil metagenome]
MWVFLRKKTFDEYGLSLPSVVKTVITFSTTINDKWYLILLGMISPMVLLTVLMVLAKPEHRRRWMLLWIAILIVLPVFVAFAAIAVLEIPMLKLAEGLNK